MIPLRVIVVLALVLSVARAYDFGCQTKWKAPSKDNAITSCIDTQYPMRAPGLIVIVAIPLVLLVVLVVVYPLFFCCRQCCQQCGGSRMRPGAGCCCDGDLWDDFQDEARTLYPVWSKRIIFIVSFVLLAISFVTLILLTNGSASALKGYDGLWSGLQVDILDWLAATLASIKATLKLDDGSYVPPLTESTFSSLDTLIVDMTKTRKDYQALAAPYIDYLKIGVNVVSIVPPALILFLVVFALCNIQNILPACCTCAYFLSAFLYLLVGTLMLFIGVIFMNFCGEIDLQKEQQPGIFQWYVVPHCESAASFDSLKSQIRTAELDNSRLACESMKVTCDTNAAWSSSSLSSMQFNFVCNLTSVNTTCNTFRDVEYIFNSSASKSGSPACTTCNMSTCPEQCSTTNPLFTAAVEAAKNATGEARKLLRLANRCINAIGIVLPILDCDDLVTRLLSPFKECNALRDGFLLIGCGFTMGGLVLVLGIMTLFKGQKVFSSNSHKAVTDVDVVMTQACQVEH